MHHTCYPLIESFHWIITIYLTFNGMKSKPSNFRWKQLLEILLILAIVGLLTFVVVFIL